jgi:hypothetical protein
VRSPGLNILSLEVIYLWVWGKQITTQIQLKHHCEKNILKYYHAIGVCFSPKDFYFETCPTWTGGPHDK